MAGGPGWGGGTGRHQSVTGAGAESGLLDSVDPVGSEKSWPLEELSSSWPSETKKSFM